MTAEIIQIPTKHNRLDNLFQAVTAKHGWSMPGDPIMGVVALEDLGDTIQAITKRTGEACDVLINGDGTTAAIMTTGLGV